ncbi:MAG: methyltransferase [Arenimonas sp.]
MTKNYDRAYFDRWYRNSKHERDSRALLERKVHMAVSLAEYYLERPIRSVLDVGCGEAVWRAPLLKLRPKLAYRGVDSSDYAVSRFGRARNIAFADFGQLEQLRFGAPVDLLVCSDVIHYIPDAELKRGLKGFSELCDGLAFLELWSKEDDIIGDKIGFIERPAAWYRKQFYKAGFIASGSHSYLSENLYVSAASLEVLQ